MGQDGDDTCDNVHSHCPSSTEEVVVMTMFSQDEEARARPSMDDVCEAWTSSGPGLRRRRKLVEWLFTQHLTSAMCYAVQHLVDRYMHKRAQANAGRTNDESLLILVRDVG